MKRKTFSNLIMVVLIAVVAAVGILLALHIKGDLGTDREGAAYLEEVRGDVSVKRDGVFLKAKRGSALREGDVISCGTGATVVIEVKDGYVTMGPRAEGEIVTAAEDSFEEAVLSGEVFINTRGKLTLSVNDIRFDFSDTAALLSARAGATGVSVFYGEACGASAGECAEWIGGERSVRRIPASGLSSFALSEIRKANRETATCFSDEDIGRIENERSVLSGKTDSAGAGTERAEDTSASLDETASEAAEPAEDVTASFEETGYPEETEKSAEASSDSKRGGDNKGAKENQDGESDATDSAPETESTPAPHRKTCTVTIRCDTVLSNMDALEPEKAPFVPDSGYVLYPTEVGFEDGDTAFDVLKKVCDEMGIQLEYSWTPVYDSYYVEGINHLYEFDCGVESGWLYTVNGWFPNYGASSYALEDEDSVVWCYSCVGLGADVGSGGW